MCLRAAGTRTLNPRTPPPREVQLRPIARSQAQLGNEGEQLADNRLFRPLSEYTGPAPGLVAKPIAER